MNFIYELYKNEHFTTYLVIALIVLVVLFVIVLLFGKKDQKLEETKKLQKIDLDTFKEEKKEPQKVEVVKEEMVEPKVELEEEVHEIDFEPDSKEEVVPILKEEEPVINFDEAALEKDLQEIENLKREFSNIELPEVEKKAEKPATKNNQEIFSSVFTASEEPKTEPVRNTYIDDDGEEIELPTLK